MGWAHLVAVLMASLLMTVVDASIWIDKLDKPGIAQVLAFNLAGSMLLFVHDARVGGSHTTRPPAALRASGGLSAVVASAALTAAITVPTAVSGLPELVSSLVDGKKKPLPPMWLAFVGHAIVYSTLSFCSWPWRKFASAECDDHRTASDAARAGHDCTRST